MSLTKEEKTIKSLLTALRYLDCNKECVKCEYYSTSEYPECTSVIPDAVDTLHKLIEEHFEIIKEKETLEKALDKACELIKEVVNQDCAIFDEVTLDNLYWIIERGELKEWCMKND